MEDYGVAYGFNNLPRSSPNKAATIGQPLPLSSLADIVRNQSAMAGWTEVMPLSMCIIPIPVTHRGGPSSILCRVEANAGSVLCSHDENFAFLNRKDDGTTAVRLANPKTAEYQVVRTSLLPGLLKTIRENRSVALPLKVFEVADVALKDDTRERRVSLYIRRPTADRRALTMPIQARNEKRFGAAFCSKSASA